MLRKQERETNTGDVEPRVPPLEGAGTDNIDDDEAPTATPTQPKRKRGGKRPGAGAPKGNVNAAKDKEYARLRNLLSKARSGRGKRDKYRRAAESETRAILEAAGMQDHPLAKRIGLRLTDVETEIGRLRDFCTARGRFSNRGEIKPAYAEYLKLQREDRAELRHLLGEALGNIKPEASGPRRAVFHDGTEIAPDGAPSIPPDAGDLDPVDVAGSPRIDAKGLDARHDDRPPSDGGDRRKATRSRSPLGHPLDAPDPRNRSLTRSERDSGWSGGSDEGWRTVFDQESDR